MQNSLLMARHYPRVVPHTDWIKQIFNQSVTRISALVPQMSFRRETIGGIAKCQLFSKAIVTGVL